MEINRQNYEQYFIDYLDGKLNEKQVGILMSFLEFNPDLKVEFTDIEKMSLIADGELGYATSWKKINNMSPDNE